MLETKVILVSIADAACKAREPKTYELVRKMANVEGVTIPAYEEARKEIEKAEGKEG